MALQIANKETVKKIQALARATGMSQTEAVEKAVDRLLSEQQIGDAARVWERFDAILAQIDRIPEASPKANPLEWDEVGLPR